MAKGLSVGTKIWADQINGAWQSSIDGIFETGRLLIRAKEAITHPPDFEKMIDGQLRFSGSTARRLMGIAKDERLCAHVHEVPPHWGTLYELTKLDDEAFDEALKEGLINPDMERKDVPKRPKNEQVVDRSKPLKDSAVSGNQPETSAKSAESSTTESPAVSPVAEEAVPARADLPVRTSEGTTAADDPEGRDMDRHQLEEEVSGEESVLHPEPGVHTPEAVAIAPRMPQDVLNSHLAYVSGILLPADDGTLQWYAERQSLPLEELTLTLDKLTTMEAHLRAKEAA
jgi:hypothetical protein